MKFIFLLSLCLLCSACQSMSGSMPLGSAMQGFNHGLDSGIKNGLMMREQKHREEMARQELELRKQELQLRMKGTQQQIKQQDNHIITGSIGEKEAFLYDIGDITIGNIGKEEVFIYDIGNITTGSVGDEDIFLWSPGR